MPYFAPCEDFGPFEQAVAKRKSIIPIGRRIFCPLQKKVGDRWIFSVAWLWL
jgi:hypothetical protein